MEEADLFLADLLGEPVVRARRRGPGAAPEASQFLLELYGEQDAGAGAPALPAPAPAPAPPPVTVAVRGQVIVGDQLLGSITPTATLVWLSRRDVNPPAPPAAFPDAIPVRNTAAAGGPSVTVLRLAGADPLFGFDVTLPAGAADLAAWLIVRATWDHPRISHPALRQTQTARLPVRLRGGVAEPFRTVILHPDADPRYVWIAPRLTDRAGGGGLAAAQASVSVRMRGQNSRAHYRARITFGADGAARSAGAPGTPAVLGVPADRALLVQAAEQPAGELLRRLDVAMAAPDFAANPARIRAAGSFFPVALLATIPRAARAAVPSAVPVQASALTSNALAGRRILLDPGHGVNYEFRRQARVYEWFVAHRICAAIERVWRGLGGAVVRVPTARFRTQHLNLGVTLAGFAPVDPEIARSDAVLVLDRGAIPPRRDLRVRRAAFTVPALAAALGYDERPGRDPFFAPDYRPRAEFLTDHPAFATTLAGRAAAPAAGFTLVAGSERWDAAGARYVVTFQRPGPPVERRDVALALRAGDVLPLLDRDLSFLAKASVWRSWREEMGAPYRPILGEAGSGGARPGPALLAHARRVLEAEEGRSPGPEQRRQFMAAAAPVPHAFLTVHLNADRGTGVAALVAPGSTAVSPQSRFGKRFLKYVDPFGLGRHGTGLATNPATLVAASPSPATHVYMETDFMDAPEPGVASGIRYERMNDDALFVRPAAEQMLCALAEFVLAPQPDAEIDAADLGAPR